MTLSTLQAQWLATPFAGPLVELASQALPLLSQLGQLLQGFQDRPVTPTRTYRFEHDLQALLRRLGLLLVGWTYNHLEPEEADAPAELDC
ncbi:MAG: hypothetical protein ACRDRO_29310, partial [Pseudonocardiaceae bacterium]